MSGNTQAKHYLEDIQELLEVHFEFLTYLKAKCDTMDADWDAC